MSVDKMLREMVAAEVEKALARVAASLPASEGRKHAWIKADFNQPAAVEAAARERQHTLRAWCERHQRVP